MPTYLTPGVYVEEVASGSRPIEGVGTAVAAFVGVAPAGPENQPTLIANWERYRETFGDVMPGAYLAHAVYGWFLNGGGYCYVVRVGATQPSKSPTRNQQKQVNTAPTVTVGNLAVYAKATSPNAKPVKVEISDVEGDDIPDDRFKIVVMAEGRPTEVWDNVSTKPGADNVVTKLNADSKLVTVEEVPASQGAVKLARGTFDLVAPSPAGDLSAIDKIDASDYIGDPADRTGFGGLETLDDVTIVSAPDLMAALEQGTIDLEIVKAVQTAMIAHCELMGDRIAILDPPPNFSPQQIRDWRMNDAGYDSRFAALYYSWLKVLDPATGTTRFIPPSGHIAGVWARSDAERGVHKAPANEVIRGALGLQAQVTRAEQEMLNPNGINALRVFPGRGVRVWGARTLSNDAEWRYLNVRRLFNFIEKSVFNGTQFAVFEPNDQVLWGTIERTIRSFLINQWMAGAVTGPSQEAAFFVKCDAETNPPESVDVGRVVCQVGIAPSKPAEFVIFQLQQYSGGAGSVTE